MTKLFAIAVEMRVVFVLTRRRLTLVTSAPPTNLRRLREKYIALYSDNHDLKKKAKEHKEKIKHLTTKNHKYAPSGPTLLFLPKCTDADVLTNPFSLLPFCLASITAPIRSM